MGSESSLYATIHKNMENRWEVQRVENLVGPGTPDLYYTISNTKSGWIELKHRDEWPKKEGTIVKLDHYTSQQRNWIKRFGKRGGNVFLLLQVEREYFLFNWLEAVKKVGLCTRLDLEVFSWKHWKGHVDWNELIRIL